MPAYELELAFDRDVLKIIKQARQKIMLAKPVNGGAPNVTWLSIDPFQSNVISWEEQYGIYVSDTTVKHGAHIRKISEVDFPAVDDSYYRFTNDNIFDGPYADQEVGKGTYSVQNEVNYTTYPALTFGLTQSAMVNQIPQDRKPLSATTVLSQQAIKITPFTDVFIWLQADFASETIITQVSGTASKAKFGGGVTQLSLKYMPTLGTFQSK